MSFASLLGLLDGTDPALQNCAQCGAVAAVHTGAMHLVSAGWTLIVGAAVLLSRKSTKQH
jgi:hypothetical protein